MRRTLTTIALAIALFGAVALGQSYEAHYTREVTVVSVQDSKITVEDNQGYLWSFVGEGYEKDQELTVIMYDNHTSKITDDEIIKVKK